MKRSWAGMALLAILAACGGGSSGGPGGLDERGLMLRRAESGNARAQYRLGSEYCCETVSGTRSEKNQTATVWLCRAARQGYAPAQFKLGKIYSGDLVDGIELLDRLGSLVRGPESRPRLAAMWFDLALAGGIDDAWERRRELSREMDREDEEAVTRLRRNWRKVPCEWNEVFARG